MVTEKDVRQLNAIETQDMTHIVLIGVGPLCIYSNCGRKINLGFFSFLKAVVMLNYVLFPLFTTVINIATPSTGRHVCVLLSN